MRIVPRYPRPRCPRYPSHPISSFLGRHSLAGPARPGPEAGELAPLVSGSEVRLGGASVRASPLRRAAGRRNRSARPGPGAAPGQESSGHVPPRAVTTAPVSIRPGRRVIFKLRPWPDFSVDAMMRLRKLMISGSESVGPRPSQTRTPGHRPNCLSPSRSWPRPGAGAPAAAPRRQTYRRCRGGRGADQVLGRCENHLSPSHPGESAGPSRRTAAARELEPQLAAYGGALSELTSSSGGRHLLAARIARRFTG